MSLSCFCLRGSRGLCALMLLAVASIASIAQAQGAPVRPERADPLDPQARVPAVTHTSSFEAYRRLGEDVRTPWKEANETVNRIGGWRAYAREAPAAGAPAPAADPRASAHGSHKTH